MALSASVLNHHNLYANHSLPNYASVGRLTVTILEATDLALAKPSSTCTPSPSGGVSTVTGIMNSPDGNSGRIKSISGGLSQWAASIRRSGISHSPSTLYGSLELRLLPSGFDGMSGGNLGDLYLSSSSSMSSSVVSSTSSPNRALIRRTSWQPLQCEGKLHNIGDTVAVGVTTSGENVTIGGSQSGAISIGSTVTTSGEQVPSLNTQRPAAQYHYSLPIKEQYVFDGVLSTVVVRLSLLVSETCGTSTAAPITTLGSVLIPISRLEENCTFEQWYQLSDPATGEGLRTAVKVESTFTLDPTSSGSAIGRWGYPVHTIPPIMRSPSQDTSPRDEPSPLGVNSPPDIYSPSYSTRRPVGSPPPVSTPLQSPSMMLSRRLPTGLLEYSLLLGPKFFTNEITHNLSAPGGVLRPLSSTFSTNGCGDMEDSGINSPLQEPMPSSNHMEVRHRIPENYTDVPSKIEWFACPQDVVCVRSVERPQPSIQSFVLSGSVDCGKRYGYALTFFIRTGGEVGHSSATWLSPYKSTAEGPLSPHWTPGTDEYFNNSEYANNDESSVHLPWWTPEAPSPAAASAVTNVASVILGNNHNSGFESFQTNLNSDNHISGVVTPLWTALTLCVLTRQPCYTTQRTFLLSIYRRFLLLSVQEYERCHPIPVNALRSASNRGASVTSELRGESQRSSGLFEGNDKVSNSQNRVSVDIISSLSTAEEGPTENTYQLPVEVCNLLQYVVCECPSPVQSLLTITLNLSTPMESIPNSSPRCSIDVNIDHEKRDSESPDTICFCAYPQTSLPPPPSPGQFTALLTRLGPRILVDVLCLALSEARLVFTSDDSTVLPLLCETLLALLYPFPWAHVYLPLVPRHLLCLLEAPVPFLLGVSRTDLQYWTASVAAANGGVGNRNVNDGNDRSSGNGMRGWLGGRGGLWSTGGENGRIGAGEMVDFIVVDCDRGVLVENGNSTRRELNGGFSLPPRLDRWLVMALRECLNLPAGLRKSYSWESMRQELRHPTSPTVAPVDEVMIDEEVEQLAEQEREETIRLVIYDVFFQLVKRIPACLFFLHPACPIFSRALFLAHSRRQYPSKTSTIGVEASETEELRETLEVLTSTHCFSLLTEAIHTPAVRFFLKHATSVLSSCTEISSIAPTKSMTSNTLLSEGIASRDGTGGVLPNGLRLSGRLSVLPNNLSESGVGLTSPESSSKRAQSTGGCVTENKAFRQRGLFPSWLCDYLSFVDPKRRAPTVRNILFAMRTHYNRNVFPIADPLTSGELICESPYTPGRESLQCNLEMVNICLTYDPYSTSRHPDLSSSSKDEVIVSPRDMKSPWTLTATIKSQDNTVDHMKDLENCYEQQTEGEGELVYLDPWQPLTVVSLATFLGITDTELLIRIRSDPIASLSILGPSAAALSAISLSTTTLASRSCLPETLVSPNTNGSPSAANSSFMPLMSSPLARVVRPDSESVGLDSAIREYLCHAVSLGDDDDCEEITPLLTSALRALRVQAQRTLFIRVLRHAKPSLSSQSMGGTRVEEENHLASISSSVTSATIHPLPCGAFEALARLFIGLLSLCSERGDHSVAFALLEIGGRFYTAALASNTGLDSPQGISPPSHNTPSSSTIRSSMGNSPSQVAYLLGHNATSGEVIVEFLNERTCQHPYYHSIGFWTARLAARLTPLTATLVAEQEAIKTPIAVADSLLPQTIPLSREQTTDDEKIDDKRCLNNDSDSANDSSEHGLLTTDCCIAISPPTPLGPGTANPQSIAIEARRRLTTAVITESRGLLTLMRGLRLNYPRALALVESATTLHALNEEERLDLRRLACQLWHPNLPSTNTQEVGISPNRISDSIGEMRSPLVDRWEEEVLQDITYPLSPPTNTPSQVVQPYGVGPSNEEKISVRESPAEITSLLPPMSLASPSDVDSPIPSANTAIQTTVTLPVSKKLPASISSPVIVTTPTVAASVTSVLGLANQVTHHNNGATIAYQQLSSLPHRPPSAERFSLLNLRGVNSALANEQIRHVQVQDAWLVMGGTYDGRILVVDLTSGTLLTTLRHTGTTTATAAIGPTAVDQTLPHDNILSTSGGITPSNGGSSVAVSLSELNPLVSPRRLAEDEVNQANRGLTALSTLRLPSMNSMEGLHSLLFSACSQGYIRVWGLPVTDSPTDLGSNCGSVSNQSVSALSSASAPATHSETTKNRSRSTLQRYFGLGETSTLRVSTTPLVAIRPHTARITALNTCLVSTTTTTAKSTQPWMSASGDTRGEVVLVRQTSSIARAVNLTRSLTKRSGQWSTGDPGISKLEFLWTDTSPTFSTGNPSSTNGGPSLSHVMPYLAVSTVGGSIGIVDLNYPSLPIFAAPNAHDGPVSCLRSIAPCVFISTGGDRHVRLWDLRSPPIRQTLFTQIPMSTAISPPKKKNATRTGLANVAAAVAVAALPQPNLLTSSYIIDSLANLYLRAQITPLFGGISPSLMENLSSYGDILFGKDLNTRAADGPISSLEVLKQKSGDMLVLTGVANGQLCGWDLRVSTQTPRFVSPAHSQRLSSIVAVQPTTDPLEHEFVTSSYDGSLKLWNWDTVESHTPQPQRSWQAFDELSIGITPPTGSRDVLKLSSTAFHCAGQSHHSCVVAQGLHGSVSIYSRERVATP